MSDYARANTGGATHFTAKDALTTGDPLKKVVGLQFDDEFNAILTAVNSKSDGGDLASQAQAEAGTDNTVVMTPQSVSWWAGNGAGICFDLQNLTAPAEDTFFGYDQGAGASIAFTLGDGLATTGTVLALEHLGIQDLEDGKSVV